MFAFIEGSTNERDIKFLELGLLAFFNFFSNAEPYIAVLILSFLFNMRMENLSPTEKIEIIDISLFQEGLQYFVALTFMFVIFMGTMISDTVGIKGATLLGAAHREYEVLTQEDSLDSMPISEKILRTRHLIYARNKPAILSR